MPEEACDLQVPGGHCAGPEMAIRALDSGVKKSRLPVTSTLVLGVMAGVYIGFAANFFTIIKTGNDLGFGIQQTLGGLAFSLGLILVVVGGAELFTGNTLIVMAWLSGRVTPRGLIGNWVVVYLGNFVGSLLLVWLVMGCAQYLMGDQQVGATMIKVAAAKCSMPFMVVVARGILCNALVCLAVWLCYSACSTTDKIMAIVFPITAFVACGFEHCVANMYFIPIGLAAQKALPAMAEASLTWSAFIFKNLIPSTIGNIIGGAIMVGGVYWIAYILPRTDLNPRGARRRAAERSEDALPGAGGPAPRPRRFPDQHAE